MPVPALVSCPVSRADPTAFFHSLILESLDSNGA